MSFDTSEAVNMTENIEEATEAGYLGVSFDDGDLTVAGVIGGKSAKSPPPPPKAEKAEPERKARRGE